MSVESPALREPEIQMTGASHLLVQISENDAKTAKDDPLGLNNYELVHALINIVEEFHRQGVRLERFDSLFPRHHSGYNSRCNRLN